jgi:hypothetical protein
VSGHIFFGWSAARFETLWKTTVDEVRFFTYAVPDLTAAVGTYLSPLALTPYG